MIKQILWCAGFLAAVAVVPTSSPAQGSGETLPLRVQWEADPPLDGLQAVCGEVFNDGHVAANHVLLLVEALDGSGHVINSRVLEVLGEVPSQGRSYFCVPEPAGASTYRLTVTGTDWMTTSGQ